MIEVLMCGSLMCMLLVVGIVFLWLWKQANAEARSPQAGELLANLPVGDLRKRDGGAWKLDGRVDWRKSSIATFDGAEVLRVFFDKGSGSSSATYNDNKGGVALTASPNGVPGNALIFVCDVYFEKGWNWSRGGKLGPGLWVGTGAASGGDRSSTGASCRVVFEQGGSAVCYIYTPTGLSQTDPTFKKSGTGTQRLEDKFPTGTFVVGQWNHVEIGIRMNTFDSNGNPNADGMALLHVNGRTGTVPNIRWSKSRDMNIERINVHPFFGGDTPSAVDCVAYYKNFGLFKWA